MLYIIGTLLLSIFFFVSMLFISSLLYKRRMNVRYSIRNMFPFEIVYKTTLATNFYTFLFVALFVMSSIGFFATFDISFTNGFNIFAMIAGILSSILIFAIILTPLTNLRLHLIFAVSFFTLNFACSGSILISAWKHNQEVSTPLSIISIGIGIAIVLCQFATMFNPRLSLKFKAEQKIDEKGEVVMVRPKWVVFAFTEWLNIFLMLLNMISITILMFAK